MTESHVMHELPAAAGPVTAADAQLLFGRLKEATAFARQCHGLARSTLQLAHETHRAARTQYAAIRLARKYLERKHRQEALNTLAVIAPPTEITPAEIPPLPGWIQEI
jgi:hypothetical protein